MKRETAYFAAGCFWGVQARLDALPGVVETQVGYMGGHLPNPDYRSVCSGATGHAETVKAVFDPEQIAYVDLLDAFFQLHDPTQLNRQGPDIGTQYRSAIFPVNDRQRAEAEAGIQRWQGHFPRPIVTTIETADTFWPAEDYHQHYLKRRGGHCHL
ncbi:peptide-methionine (S)-S-oxide reductase [Sulfurivirga caldicuralii]|uniref:Peptide methionine sulfoxide reductase MsrA n=1 Tax=Sulfurivirga caldicuralii TaxID=364032 RepID=A0A1N6GSJ3_9GAMM|nr:peptide-methionine (S)-S-oxide reductase MsrA [Sulfurivirga caldicuralii]SIO10489.1 peptide-methionine (S)-S-oxide reductase [Sulfurivirga caldicuralii]